jgi:hypothetical protein
LGSRDSENEKLLLDALEKDWKKASINSLPNSNQFQSFRVSPVESFHR